MNFRRRRPTTGPGRPGPPVPSLAWPPPLPGRTEWAWLLRLPWRRRRVRRVLALLDGRVGTGSLLLDIGGGTGVGTEEATRRAAQGTYRRRIVLDPQRGMLVRFPERTSRAEGLEAVVADGIRLPISDRSVDVVLSLGVLCCMTDDAIPGAVEEIYRVLRPGGLAVVTVPRPRGDADEPLFLAHGFVRLAKLRPGRTLYARPKAS